MAGKMAADDSDVSSISSQLAAKAWPAIRHGRASTIGFRVACCTIIQWRRAMGVLYYIYDGRSMANDVPADDEIIVKPALPRARVD